MSEAEAKVRTGHGMLPEHPQMECVECGAWSYLAARTDGRAGRCYGCEMDEREGTGSKADPS